jgi:alpha-tubulin suppressor-like RCC1 family protein
MKQAFVILISAFVLSASAFVLSASAAVPHLLNHQGRVAVQGINFHGSGQFKFALVNSTATTSYWSNDGSSIAGSQPATAVTLNVTKGLYAVLLGDATLPNMTTVPATVFDNESVNLRVWFNDGTHGFQHLAPDQRLAAVGYALVAEKVSQVMLSEVVAAPVKPVIAWGNNSQGQTTVPAPLADVAAIAAGESHSLALLKNGTVIAWGGSMTVPGGLTNVTAIAAGTAHNVARKSDGTVIAWGANDLGQSTVPPTLTNVIAIAAGEKHSLALKADGTVVAWGDNTFNQTAVPVGLANVTAIACGYGHSLALKADGTVVAWGRNEVLQTDVPPGLANVTAIACGAYHSLAVKNDGTVIAWGWNDGQQCDVPPSLTGVSRISGGYDHTVALKTDGTLVTWGDGPALPAALSQITAISARADHVLALVSDLIPAQVARLDQDNVFTGRLGIKRTAAANNLEVEGNASKTTAGNWLANSDRRIKDDIQPISGAVEKLAKVRLVDFTYKPAYRAAHPGLDGKRYLNVIAQEFAQVFPDHVQPSGETLPDGSPILQVDTYPLTIYSAAAVQELARENKALKEQAATFEDRLRKLEAERK